MLKAIKKGIVVMISAIALVGAPMMVPSVMAPTVEAADRGMMDIEGYYSIDWCWGDSDLRFRLDGVTFGDYPLVYNGRDTMPDGYSEFFVTVTEEDGPHDWVIQSGVIDGHFGVRLYKRINGDLKFQGKGRVVY